MTKKIVLSAIAASVMASSVMATNGDHLIGIGAKARSMGGVGIATSFGAESGIANPALITSVKDSEVSFGGTVFMPDVSASMGGNPYDDSAADMSVIPSVSLATKVNDNLYIGLGMWGTAGMGVDYGEAPTSLTDAGNMNMATSLQLMQFGLPMAFKEGGISLGVMPFVQYGALDINFNDLQGNTVGSGVSQDLSTGYNIGISYTEDILTVGYLYKSSVEMEYLGQLSTATQSFVNAGIFSAAMSDVLEQPAERGVGISLKFDSVRFAIDAKEILWEEAIGYKDFGWENQEVIAVGFEKLFDTWSFRIGYNHAENPISESQSGPASIPAGSWDQAGGNAMNLFNLLGFPATVEEHYSFGLSVQASDEFSLDLAYVYTPESTVSMQTITGTDGTNLFTGTSTVKHTQSSVSIQANLAF